MKDLLLAALLLAPLVELHAAQALYGQTGRTSEFAGIYDGSEKLPLGVCAASI